MAISLLNAGPNTQVAQPADLPYAMVRPGEWDEFSGSGVQDGVEYDVRYDDAGSAPPDFYVYTLYGDDNLIEGVTVQEENPLSLTFEQSRITATRSSLPGHLLDRAVNLVSASSTTDLILPQRVEGKVRDLMVRLDVTGSSQQVSFSAPSGEPTVTWLGGNPPSSFDVGVHLISISESDDGEFVFIDGMSEDFETITNKVTSIDALSTDAQYPSAKCVYNALALKANKSEMTITPGTGANADKTTIQLKSGTSATVLTQHQDISGKANTGDIHNATITITQGGVTKGTFTLNQSTDQTIALDAGGGGGGGGASGYNVKIDIETYAPHGDVTINGSLVVSGDWSGVIKVNNNPIGTNVMVFSGVESVTCNFPHDGYYSNSSTMNGSPCSSGTYQITYDSYIHISVSDCLSPDTSITMSDGSTKRITDVKVGDRILTPLGEDIIVEVSNGSGDAIDSWEFDDGTVVKTVGRHRFFNCELNEPMYLEAWKLGEHALRSDGVKIKLVSHVQKDTPSPHATLFTEKYNLYYANGLLSGNRRSVGYKEIKL